MDLKSNYHPPFVKTILLQSLQFLFMEIFTHAKIITYRVCAVTSVSDHWDKNEKRLKQINWSVHLPNGGILTASFPAMTMTKNDDSPTPIDAPLNKAWSNIEATLPITTPAN